VIANVDRLEQLRQRVIDGWRSWALDSAQPRQQTYSVGDYVCVYKPFVRVLLLRALELEQQPPSRGNA
jgi:hypothetical protein